MISRAAGIDRQIELRDGRKLGYAEYGSPEGKPVLFVHGSPGSLLDWLMFDTDDTAARLNVRIIAIDRPGMGLSDFKRGRAILDWPDDVVELMDRLQVDRFAVLAVSGGGPYGDACAFKIPERLAAVGIVSGMGPADAPGAKKGGSWTLPGKPGLIRKPLLALMVKGLLQAPERFETQIEGTVSEPDRKLMAERPELKKMIVESWREAFRSGIGGVNHESGLYARPWGFRLQAIAVEVQLWHGENDNNVPGSVGHYVAEAIPSCRAAFLEGEGHFTLIHNHLPEILGVLAQ